MSRRHVRLPAAFALAVAACGSDAQPVQEPGFVGPGTDAGGADAGAGGQAAAAGSAGSSTAGTGGTPYPGCAFSTGEPCAACMHGLCGPECALCSGNPACGQLFGCMTSCSTSACQNLCLDKYAAGIKDFQTFITPGCLSHKCHAVCPVVPSSGTGGTGGSAGAAGDGGPPADPFESARQLCAEKTNQYRAQAGTFPLLRYTTQEPCADSQATADAKASTPHGSFGACSESAQNECPGLDGSVESVVAACLQVMFAEGPGTDYAKHSHYLNMTNPAYSRVSCGFYVTSLKKVWFVQNFY
jgi:hypothetical protein